MTEADCRWLVNGLQKAQRCMELQERARMGVSPHAQANTDTQAFII